ncbi:hypothetical protein [Mariniblastus fucicola]|uniref:Dockerin domain-containing protein n=1 Tax=Mariniblastus fucicola TaxID=980251 RepID=A0A5B9PEB5_9BACT|nr:hypothetical protein [Mariniblastus fucicola]QEG22916.1 hypothetical protein MFFC18_28040 [Mariniblastus fucicola]
MRHLLFTIAIALLSLAQTAKGLEAQTIVASEDFDGGATNLISSNVPTEDGGGGDTFAVGATAAWPTTGGTPFAIADNTVGDVGDSGFFEADNEGIFGVNSDFTNMFLGISDSDDIGDVTAEWQFDISSAGSSPLSLSVDIGSMEGSDFAYSADTVLRFEASIDGGVSQVVFDIVADPAGNGYTYRALDNGVEVVANDNALSVTGDNTVTKFLANDGTAAADLFVDKSLASDGTLDTFTTAIDGAGSTLTITLTANVPFEAIAFDNLAVSVPEDTTIKGDGDGDGDVDFVDLDLFANVLFGTSPYDAVFDFDEDADVDFVDLDLFANVLFGL